MCQPQGEIPEEEKEITHASHSLFNCWLCGLGHVILLFEPHFIIRKVKE